MTSAKCYGGKKQQFSCSPASPYAPSKLLFFLKRAWEQERDALVGR